MYKVEKRKQKKEAKKNKRKVPPPLHEEEEEEEEDLFMDFQIFWPLVSNRGRVAHLYRAECEQLWRTYSDEQQRAIYDAIERKLLSGRFVSYRPTDAIRDNAPKKLIISADEYYRRYGTQANLDGWVRTFLPEEQRTIYVKT